MPERLTQGVYMRTSLNQTIAQRSFSDVRKLKQYIWQLEDELAELRFQVKTLSREKENEFMNNMILRSQVEILNMISM